MKPTPSHRPLVHASLCSGFGAAELAARWMGWENAYWCENNSFCQRVLGYHFPKSKQYGDLIETDFTEWCGRIDVLTAGFPCQPFSLAGRRKGAEDDRFLWPQVRRALAEVRPPFFVGENVAGITSMVLPGEEVNVETQGSLFKASDVDKVREQQFVIETICQDLEDTGYAVQPIAIPACAVGAPHLRMRIYFLAYSASYAAERRRHGETKKTDAMPDRQRDVSRNPQYRNIGEIGVASDTYQDRFKVRRTGGDWQKKATIIRKNSYGPDKRFGSERLASDAQYGGWEQDNESQFSEQPEQGIPDWSGFPTQSPVCGRDDGISRRLDAITFPSWRGKSIEGYGNAIVPQVMYEIFKGIEAVTSKSL